MAWQIPSEQFLLDFANLHNHKSIIIYLPNIQNQLITGMDKQLIDFRKTASIRSLKISCVFHEKVANLTHMSVLNDDLHIFIPNDSDLTHSFDVFINLYSLRKKWNQEYWLLGSIALLPHNTLKQSAILGLSFFVRCWWPRESMLQG